MWIKGHDTCIAVRVHHYGKLMRFVPCPQSLWIVISTKGRGGFIIAGWIGHEFLVVLSFLPSSHTLGELCAQNTLLTIILFACSSLYSLAAWVQPYFLQSFAVLTIHDREDVLKSGFRICFYWQTSLSHDSLEGSLNLMNFYSVGW